MEDQIHNFLEYLKNENKSINSLKSYSLNLKEYFNWFKDSYSKYPEKLYRSNVQDYKSYLLNVKKLNPKSVNQKLSTLRKFNSFLIDNNIQEDYVIRKSDLIKVQQDYASPAKVSELEIKSFLQKILEKEDLRYFSLVTLLAYSGLRISEALNIELNDFNLTSGECVIRSGKGGKYRRIPLHSKAVNALKEYLKDREKFKFAKTSHYLFISQQSAKLDRTTINKLLKKHSDKITPHQLRHFFCTYALENGLSIHEVANIAGHSNIHTTMIYTNPDREKLKQKMENL